MRSTRHVLIAGATVTALLATACSGVGAGGSADGKSINVLMVGNPQMHDIAKLTQSNFTKETGIEVNFTVLPENELRDKVSRDIATRAGQYDVVTIGAYEAAIWDFNGWLRNLNGEFELSSSFDRNDLLEPMMKSLSGSDGRPYAVPFYGESSFLMYRKDVFAEKGLTMPERPTWQQVADLVAKADGAKPGMKGICLRGRPGWGELGAPLTSMVNTFGGAWFTKDWTARVNTGGFKEATQFYVDLVRKHGEAGAAQAGFTECLNAMSQGKVAMWYDATSAAGSLEDPTTSKVAGKIGYAYAPVEKTDSSGWLWAWAWAMPETTKKSHLASKFMLWASSKEYEKLVGEKLGWSRVPAGKRASTYQIPQYKKAAASFGDITLKSIEQADPSDPGTQPRPTVGIQFVAIPEFQDLGTKVTQEISAAIAGKTSVETALNRAQKLAEDVAEDYR
ncbi:sugar ABC transporter substrate-binding protein [Streptomyces sp. NPDC047880]|uniref:ABC transporter substrate-binding protein n=1 Tax=Streptomyces sp. NPDC047880 TaxID=3155626 RepID=UPI003451C130